MAEKSKNKAKMLGEHLGEYENKLEVGKKRSWAKKKNNRETKNGEETFWLYTDLKVVDVKRYYNH